jgi:hypothetical protein
MERIYFIEHKGKKLLYEDFTNLTPQDDYKSVLAQAQAIIASQPPKSVLAVFVATGCHFDGEMVNSLKSFTNANTPYIKAAATVGITGLMSIAQEAISKFAGRTFKTFQDVEAAKDWLIEQ